MVKHQEDLEQGKKRKEQTESWGPSLFLLRIAEKPVIFTVNVL